MPIPRGARDLSRLIIISPSERNRTEADEFAQRPRIRYSAIRNTQYASFGYAIPQHACRIMHHASFITAICQRAARPVQRTDLLSGCKKSQFAPKIISEPLLPLATRDERRKPDTNATDFIENLTPVNTFVAKSYFSTEERVARATCPSWRDTSPTVPCNPSTM